MRMQAAEGDEQACRDMSELYAHNLDLDISAWARE